MFLNDGISGIGITPFGNLRNCDYSIPVISTNESLQNQTNQTIAKTAGSGYDGWYVTPTSFQFLDATVGYVDPEYSNYGLVTVTSSWRSVSSPKITNTSTDFSYPRSLNTILQGYSRTFKVSPKQGLRQGTYKGVLQITGNTITKEVALSFTVVSRRSVSGILLNSWLTVHSERDVRLAEGRTLNFERDYRNEWLDEFRRFRIQHNYNGVLCDADWYSYEKSLERANEYVDGTSRADFITTKNVIGAPVNPSDRYWVAVGPGVVDDTLYSQGMSLASTRVLNAMYGPEPRVGRKIDVHITDDSGIPYWIYCIIGDTKEHTGSGRISYQDGSIQNVNGHGIYQTYISVTENPNSNKIYVADDADGHADGSIIEFMCAKPDETKGNLSRYKLVEIIVY